MHTELTAADSDSAVELMERVNIPWLESPFVEPLLEQSSLDEDTSGSRANWDRRPSTPGIRERFGH